MQQQPVIERMSVHAASRQRQRGVSDLQLELLTRYGALSRQKGARSCAPSAAASSRACAGRSTASTASAS